VNTTQNHGAITPAHQLRAQRFANPVFALGMATSYLMNKPAFAALPFGHWSRVLIGQINRGHYLFVLSGKSVVGFAGWALASTRDAEAWLAGRSDPAAQDGRAGECIILNVWDASTAEAHKMLVDEMRRVVKDKVAIYAKREYGGGRSRPLKLRVNEFIRKHIEAADGGAKAASTALRQHHAEFAAK